MSTIEQNQLARLLQTCEDEPIETPGSIQSHGALIIWDYESGTIEATSENLSAYTGIDPHQIMGVSIEQVFPEQICHVINNGLRESLKVNPIPYTAPSGHKLNCILTRTGMRGLAELEPRDISNEVLSVQTPFDAYMGLIQSSQVQDTASAELGSYLDFCAKSLKYYSGFDRVLVYRFMHDQSGEVIAEAKNPELEPFMDMRYPASDIPRRARELYKKNLLRVITDIRSEPVPLLAGSIEPDEFDLSDCALRSPSHVHIKYLDNMGVRATMVSSIVVGDKLWGLIACHHYKPYVVPYVMRAASQLFTSNVAANISMLEHLEYERQLARSRKSIHGIVENLSTEAQLVEALEVHIEQLLPVFHADGATLIHEDEFVHIGLHPRKASIMDVCERIDATHDSHPLADTQADIGPATQSDVLLPGYLGIKLSSDMHLIFWRVEERETIKWAGKPDEHVVVHEHGEERLMPRGSFALWSETTQGRSKPWDQVLIDLLDEFRVSFTTLLLQQNDRLGRLNDDLRAKNTEMEAFAYSVSHDLKTPLVTLTSFLTLLEEDLELGEIEEAKDSVKRMRRSASKMSQLIDDMLELSRIGNVAQSVQSLELGSIAHSIEDTSTALIQEKSATLHIANQDLRFVGNPSSIARMLSNLVTNALKYGCTEPGMQVRIGAKQTRRYTTLYVEDDGPGIPKEYHERVFRLFERMDTQTGGSGIGLAIVQKIANAHRGSVKLMSSESGGARFEILLPHDPAPTQSASERKK